MRAGLLEAIESGTIDEVATPAVAQAHRRVYARFLGFDADAGSQADADDEAELVAIWSAAEPRAPAAERAAPPAAPEPAAPAEPAPPPSPPPQEWWYRRSVMIVAVAVFSIGLLISIVLALAAGYG